VCGACSYFYVERERQERERERERERRENFFKGRKVQKKKEQEDKAIIVVCEIYIYSR